MARSRNIKPGFFANDELAEIEPLGRLLFAGLWTIADRDGRLEDRPKKIKAAVLAYDECDVDALLDQLAVRGFIVRYEVDGVRLIQVTTWDRHQNPHKNEPLSTLAPCEHCTSTVQEPELNSSDREDSSPKTTDSSPKAKGRLDAPAPAREAASSAARRGEKGQAVEFSETERERITELEPILAAVTGLKASPQFWRTTLDKYGGVDLVEESHKFAAWAEARPDVIVTSTTALNWFKRENEGNTHGRNGTARRASSDGGKSSDDRYPELAKFN